MARSSALAIAVVLALALPGSAQANTIAQSRTVQDTDVKYAGVGNMRSTGTGTLTVSGVPTGSVAAAYLYWHGPTNTANPAANSAVVFNGAPLNGANIGLADHNCWAGAPTNFVNSQSYFADVTSRVSGNGSYSLTNFVKSGGGVTANGASLVVLYDDGNASNDRDVVIFDGNDSNVASIYDAEGWAATMGGLNYTAGSGSLDLHVSDGQTFPEEALVVNGVEVVPAGTIFNGAGEEGGAGTNQLWDIKPVDVTARLAADPNTLAFASGFDDDDCLSLIVAIVNVPAGAAPPPAAPATSTGGAAPGVTSSSLSGSVDPNGEATSYRFQYGKTTAYGSQTALGSVHAGTSAVPVSAAAGGLQPSTTYHYRVIAFNAGGPAAGVDRTFTTRAAPSADEGGVLGDTAQSPAPVARKTVVIAEVSGSVLLKVPGSKKFVPIGLARSIPVGSQIDARKGRVRLTSAADANGKTQSALFYDGIFKVGYATEALASGKKRRKKAMRVLITQAALVGKVGPCPRAKKAGASAKRRKRRLWGNGKGRFRTRGRRSSALVRGTTWLVEDRCDGTLTRVTKGSVTVRDFARRKNVIVKKGRKYLARAKR